MNNELIKPQTLKGFRDYLPQQMLAREELIETARTVYRQYGFAPIDTPALEYARILLGKSGEETDKQLFRFTDQGDRDVAMRFDLTVPFARFSAQYAHELGMPFKRYHIGTVWRGEKPGKGRFREFMQCDFDTIGTTGIASDIETLLVIHDLLEAIGFERFTIRVNNRLVLNGLLETLNLTESAPDVLRALDKLLKIGRDAVIAEMQRTADASREQAMSVLDFVLLGSPSDATSPLEVIEQLQPKLSSSETGTDGIAALRALFTACAEVGIPAERVALDLSIARGLDYYTGTIYETFLDDLPEIGSVCSGGRYDDLAGLFTSQQLPGVGASLGLDRLLAAMEELNLTPDALTPAAVLVTQLDSAHLGDYLRLGRRLREAGIATELFPDSKGVGKQLKYANRKRFRLAIIAGDEEFTAGQWQIKDLTVGEQQTVSDADVVSSVERLLRAGEGE